MGSAEVLALFGPTAAGKSALAHAAARALGGEIVVADPFQRYRGLEIAADAPEAAHRHEVRYHLVGDLSLDEASSAGAFSERAHTAVDEVLRHERVPIVAGGSGLYLRAAVADLAFDKPPDDGLRRRAEADVADDPKEAAERLTELDPGAARSVDLQNPRRLARALERAMAGEREPERDRLWDAPPRRPTLLVAVTRPRPVLDRLIADRVQREIADGLVAEVRRALAHPHARREPLQIIGAREVAALDRGELAEEDLSERLAARTRRLARRQLSWLRHMPDAVTLDLGEEPAETALPRLLDAWRQASRG